MSKLIQLSAWTFSAFLPLVLAVPVSAESTCQIGFTGPDSNNQCTSTTKYKCEAKNDNNVSVINENVQFALSGNGSVTGNTNGGNVRTGSATNSNNVTFTATVTNNDICTVVATVPGTPVTPTPVGGSGAAGAGSVAPAAQPVRAVGGSGAARPTVLANTGDAGILSAVIGIVSASAFMLIASRLYATYYKV